MLFSLICFLFFFSSIGCKLFGTLPPNSSMAYKYISMILQCTGGGILVPLLLNSIPVPIGQDSYPIMITISFLIHYYFPMLRDVTHQSSILYGMMVVLYEIMRSYVVVKFITLANNTIPPSDFTIPVFGPIFCGTIAGCGAAFVPFNKGLDAIKQSISSPMISACLASIFYHCIVNGSTVLQPNASDKAHVLITIYFIAYHLSTDFHHVKSIPSSTSSSSETTTTDVKKQL
jgi:hypothetical protein